MMNYKRLRIGTDCDGCIDDFWNPYVKKFGYPKSDKEITRNVQRIRKEDDVKRKNINDNEAIK